ncbi:right-handed parallel beta-helix repeat-containing protein [Virgibacillus oceani]|uniref:Carbohydrate-binding/sugar hydrolysis domain-containing protein n=1 Tax=Virgibacillus oceani TaxID=1479511 RepID=A0A917HEQ0_9BACI|nr:right-handed parallel beta-helix repeat-containing protein [Virgibacillus oceani]GGG76942.1 hypothetical protein GCM10011398_22480 [Virgibacillus oceani]
MKNTILVLLAAFAIIIALVFNHTNADEQQENANFIYVATNGNDQNNGTKEKPFRTLKKAASEAIAGSTIFIRKGTYNEKLVIKHSGTKSKPIAFKAYEDEEVILSGENQKDVEGDTSMVMLNNKNYITIDGITIQDLTTDLTDETVMGIFVTGSSSQITLKNNHVQHIETYADDGNGHGIAIYGTGPMKDITIQNNTVENLKLGSSEALVLNGNIDGFKVENNLVRRNDNIGIDLIGYEGVATNEKADYVRNGTVSNNTVYEISSYGNPAYGEDYSAGGIYIDGGKNITVEENTIYKCDIGIEATSEHAGKYADNISIINNIVHSNYYTGISIGGYDEDRGGTINSTISHNIMYRNDTKGLYGGQLLLQHDIKNNLIERNILTAGPSRVFIANEFTTNQGNKLQRNVFHKEKGKDGIWIWKNEEYISFPTFKTASKSDEKTSYLDPGYKNADEFNFELENDSPARKIVE